MVWTVEKYENTNVQKFKNEDLEVICAPIIINERYKIIDIFCVTGDTAVIFKAIDTKLDDRNVLIKAKRYENEHGLFNYKNDLTRKDKVNAIRENIEFECDSLVTLKKHGETRVPNVNNLVVGFCPMLYGPHKSADGEEFYNSDVEMYNNEPYIVMQMINGINLGEYVSNGIEFVMNDRLYTKYSMWEWDVMQYAIEICGALSSMHTENVDGIQSDSDVKSFYYIYQDLKPENIIVSDDIFINLINFSGITMVVKYKDGREISNIQGFGVPGYGTEEYKAPETKNQEMLGVLDQRVDVYSLGATLYHLLIGESLKFSKTTNDEIDIEDIKDHYTNETYELIKKCLQPKKENRFKTVDDIKDYIMDDIIPVIKRDGNE